MPKVTFEREQVVVEAEVGQTLLEVAEKHGVDLFRGMWTDLHCRRLKGWCNRCKVWVKAEAGAVNPPTAKELFPLRLNGKVAGTMRLACQVQVGGDVTVHTRAGGPSVAANPVWEPSTRPAKWKERWEGRHEAGGDEEGDDQEETTPPEPKAASGGELAAGKRS